MKKLVIYYSRTGNTKKVAEFIAKRAGADIEELIDLKNRTGEFWKKEAGRDAVDKSLTKLREVQKNPQDYDAIFIGTPVWASNITPAVRTYLKQYKVCRKNIILFCTAKSVGTAEVLNDLESLIRDSYFLGNLSILEEEIKTKRYKEKVNSFLARLNFSKLPLTELLKVLKKDLESIYRERSIKACLNYALLKLSTRINSSWIYGYPHQAQIQVTDVCNLKCKMCLKNRIKIRLKNKHLTFDKFKLALSKLSCCSFLILHASVGEPLANPHIFDMIKYSNSKGIKTMFYTNGILLDTEISRNIIDAGLTNIGISLDAADKKKFRNLRGTDLDLIIKNVKGLIELKEQLKSDFPKIKIIFVAMKSNIVELPKLVALAKSLKIDSIRVLGLDSSYSYSDFSKKEGMSEYQMMWLSRYKSHLFRNKFYLDLELPPNEPFDENKNHCPWGSFRIFIDIEGNIKPCHRFAEENLNFGNIYRDELTKVWNSKKLRVFRKEHLYSVQKCKNCFYRA